MAAPIAANIGLKRHLEPPADACFGGSDTTLFQQLTRAMDVEVLPAECLTMLAVVIKDDQKKLCNSSTSRGPPNFRKFASKLAQVQPQRGLLKQTADVIKRFEKGIDKTTVGLLAAMRAALNFNVSLLDEVTKVRLRSYQHLAG